MKKTAKIVLSILVISAFLFLTVIFMAENTKAPAVKENILFQQSEGQGMSLASEVIEDESGNLTTVITATITPDNATNKLVDWSLEWTNAESEFAQGKDVSDYMTIATAEDGALSATLTCLQAFGEQIKVKVVLRANNDITASATCDYVKRVESATVAKSAELIDLSDITVGATANYGAGTLDGEFAISYVQLTLTEGFKSEIKSYLSDTANSRIYFRSNLLTTYENGVLTFGDAEFIDVILSDYTYRQPGGGDITPVPGGGETPLSGAFDEQNVATPCAVIPNQDFIISYSADFISAYNKALASYDGAHVVLKVGYVYTFEGEEYSRGVATDYMNFSETLVVNASSVETSGNVIF